MKHSDAQFNALFNPAVKRVTLERVDGELIVTDVEFDSEEQRAATSSLPQRSLPTEGRR